MDQVEDLGDDADTGCTPAERRSLGVGVRLLEVARGDEDTPGVPTRAPRRRRRGAAPRLSVVLEVSTLSRKARPRHVVGRKP